MEKRSVGFIEAVGLSCAVEAADAAVKSGNVRLLGYEYSGYDGRIVVKIEGKIGDVKAAIAAAAGATQRIDGTMKGYDRILTKGALDSQVYDTLVHNAETVGDELQIASGRRPQGTNKTGKFVGKWKQAGCYIYE
ncbi:MAG: BMC domain-containing protein [Lachnospiraceae bacterium]|nr:BMC domain-containing protein [Lachnospiraceae bacterium]